MNGGHGTRYGKAQMKKKWRALGFARMASTRTQKRLPQRVQSMSVTAQQMSKNRAGLQDLGNCHEAVKAIIDGIVDTGFIPDDRFEHVAPLIYDVPDICGRDGLRLTIQYEPLKRVRK
jgi:hypothetical protein